MTEFCPVCFLSFGPRALSGVYPTFPSQTTDDIVWSLIFIFYLLLFRPTYNVPLLYPLLSSQTPEFLISEGLSARTLLCNNLSHIIGSISPPLWRQIRIIFALFFLFFLHLSYSAPPTGSYIHYGRQEVSA